MAAVAAADAHKDSDGHTRVYSGEVVWRPTCGAYADKKVHGMKSVCKGAPKREEEEGRRDSPCQREQQTQEETHPTLGNQ